MGRSPSMRVPSLSAMARSRTGTGGYENSARSPSRPQSPSPSPSPPRAHSPHYALSPGPLLARSKTAPVISQDEWSPVPPRRPTLVRAKTGPVLAEECSPARPRGENSDELQVSRKSSSKHLMPGAHQPTFLFPGSAVATDASLVADAIDRRPRRASTKPECAADYADVMINRQSCSSRVLRSQRRLQTAPGGASMPVGRYRIDVDESSSGSSSSPSPGRS